MKKEEVERAKREENDTQKRWDGIGSPGLYNIHPVGVQAGLHRTIR